MQWPRLRAWRSKVRISAWAGDFCLLHNVQTGSGAHTTFFSMRIGVLYQRWRGWSVILTTYLSPVPRLRIVEVNLYSPDLPSWCGLGQLSLTLLWKIIRNADSCWCSCDVTRSPATVVTDLNVCNRVSDAGTGVGYFLVHFYTWCPK